MKKRIIIVLLSLAFSLLHPMLFYYYEGEHVKVSETTYKVRDNSHNHTSEIEKYAQMRIIYQAYKNIKLNRVFSLSTIDDMTVANSYPIYQYYNFGVSHILGSLLFIINDVILAYTVGLWLFSVLFVIGTYLLVATISRSPRTALLTILIFLTYPYFLVNLLTRYANAEYFAISMVPMLLYLVIRLLEKGTTLHSFKDRKKIAEYCLYMAAFILLGSVFIITHNITTLYTPVVLAIPFLVYIWTTIKPSIRSIMLLIIPLCLIGANGLFILVPVAQNQHSLLISDTFAGLLFPNFRLNDMSVAFRVFPYTSPFSGQPYLTLQFGLPILLLSLFFFQVRKIYIYILITLVAWMIVAPNIWYILPPIFYVTQFSMRLFTYIPLLLLFAAKPLHKKVLIGMTIVTLFFSFFFVQRPNRPGSLIENDYDRFPSENHWNYMQRGENQNIPAPVAVNPPTETIIPEKISEHIYSIDTIQNPDYSRKAVTYVITVPPEQKPELFHATATSTFRDGRKVDDFAEYWAVNNTIVLSYCLPNTKLFHVQFEVPAHLKEEISVQRLAEPQYMHIDPALIAATCDYEYKNNGKEYVFALDAKYAKTQLLPVFYSPYNVVTGEDGARLETKPFLDGAQRSYTVVMDRGKNTHIRVQLSEGNTWIPLSIITFRLSMIFCIVSGVTLFVLRNRRSAVKKV